MQRWIRTGAILGAVFLAWMTAAAVPRQGPADGTAQPGDNTYIAYTYQRADGNRFAAGRGSLPSENPLDIRLDAQPKWLLGAPTGKGSVWAAVLADGRVQGFNVVAGEVTTADIPPGQIPAGMPPLLVVRDGEPSLVGPPTDQASTLTHPVVLSAIDETLAFVDANGDLVIQGPEGELGRLAVNALPDARLLLDDSGRILLLSDPTDTYEHGVLGDNLEASSIKRVVPGPEPYIELDISLVEGVVAEGIAPIWTDLSGDGVPDIIATLSDAEQGAQVVVFDKDGLPQVGGPGVGRGQRWRHVIAVAPLGPNGEKELVDVLTPHLGGVAEFYRWGVHRLDILARLGEFSSHQAGSRNLDQAAVGDFDGDGRVELLVPGPSARTLVAIRRTVDSVDPEEPGAEQVWALPSGGLILTNLATVTFPDGSMGVGVGHNGPGLRLWLPK